MSKPRSLSLAAYRVLSWGVAQQNIRPDQPRPDGELVWVHIATRDRLRAISDFCLRLQQARPGLSILLSAPPEIDLSRWTGSPFPMVNLPAEQTGAARAFLDHWKPDLGLWVGGGLMPSIITRAYERSIPMLLIEAQLDVVLSRNARWLPDISRYTFDCFEHILTTTEETARQIRRMGVASSKVRTAPPLQFSPNPQPWPEEELIEANHALAGRPVWLAARVQAKEFISVLSAHRQALRILPRLALILHVADRAEAAPLQRRLETMDLRCSNWDDGGSIEDTTQVIVSSEPEDLGLWQRVSPVSFMANSLERGAGGQDPLDAVALGSAVIYGPHIDIYQSVYARLAEAGAAHPVKTATELGDAIVALLAPDRAAGMALAGWQAITEGAPQTEQLTDMLQDLLDQRSTHDARA